MTTPTGSRPPHLGRWGWAGLISRLRRLARRTRDPRALASAIAVVATALVTLTLVGGPPSLLVRDQLTIHQAETRPVPDGPPAPRQAPRPIGAAPQPSPTTDFLSWAILDQQTGAITGSDNLAETNTTASMIKAWLVADYLRLADQADEQPSAAQLTELTPIIRDSDNARTQTIFETLGGAASIERLIEICELTDSSPAGNSWSNTQLSARDTARMGACLADGRAAGPTWTNWVVNEMREVRGIGDFGIRDALPEAQRDSVAIKNGWVIREDENAWHVNCLAVGDGWTMGVLMRYPVELGFEHGAALCTSLAARHLA